MAITASEYRDLIHYGVIILTDEQLIDFFIEEDIKGFSAMYRDVVYSCREDKTKPAQPVGNKVKFTTPFTEFVYEELRKGESGVEWDDREQMTFRITDIYKLSFSWQSKPSHQRKTCFLSELKRLLNYAVDNKILNEIGMDKYGFRFVQIK